MTLKVAEAVRNNNLGMVAQVKGHASNGEMGGTLAYVDGGASNDTITATAGSFIDQGFAPGDLLYTFGSTTAANDLSGVTIVDVASQTLTLASGSIDTAENFVAASYMVCCKGGSVRDIFKDGVLRIYSGSQPTNPEDAVNGTLLVEITQGAGTFAAGSPDNGLEFEDADDGVLSKSSDETWQGVGVSSGVAGWFRFVGNATDNGAASTSLPRIDGNVGTSGADLNMQSTQINSGGTYTIDEFSLNMAQYYGA